MMRTGRHGGTKARRHGCLHLPSCLRAFVPPCLLPTPRSILHDPVDPTPGAAAVDVLERHDVQLAIGVLAEGSDEWPLPFAQDLLVGCHLSVLVAQTPEAAGGVVAVDVEPAQLLVALAAIDVPAGDGEAFTMAVFNDGINERVGRASLDVAVAAFLDRKSVV